VLDYLTANYEPDCLNVEQAISLAAGLAETNQLVPYANDVCIMHVKEPALRHLVSMNELDVSLFTYNFSIICGNLFYVRPADVS